MSLETLVNLSAALDISTDYLLFGDRQTGFESLSDMLSGLEESHRVKVESAFKVLLPYIK